MTVTPASGARHESDLLSCTRTGTRRLARTHTAAAVAEVAALAALAAATDVTTDHG